MVNKQGFTLIELLVVVLIIGILSAVALPQYQVAVAKSRLAAVMPLTKSLKEGQELLYLYNGAYEDKVDNMDIGWPGDCVSQGGGQLNCGKTKYDVGHINVVGDVAGCTELNCYMLHYDHAGNAGKIECLALTGDNTAAQVCRGMGGVKGSSVSSWIGKFDRYELKK